MSPFDKMKKFEHEFAEKMAEGFWTPKDPLSDDEQDRLEHVHLTWMSRAARLLTLVLKQKKRGWRFRPPASPLDATLVTVG